MRKHFCSFKQNVLYSFHFIIQLLCSFSVFLLGKEHATMKKTPQQQTECSATTKQQQLNTTVSRMTAGEKYIEYIFQMIFFGHNTHLKTLLSTSVWCLWHSGYEHKLWREAGSNANSVIYIYVVLDMLGFFFNKFCTLLFCSVK